MARKAAVSLALSCGLFGGLRDPSEMAPSFVLTLCLAEKKQCRHVEPLKRVSRKTSFILL